MKKSLFLPGSSKILFAELLLLVVFCFGGLITPKALAGSTDSSSSCANNDGIHASPYNGGADMARVFYPSDGSTVTVTNTGAVIKQSPCGTPYRQGWVNPANISCLNSYSQLSGQMSSGSSSPYPNNVYNPSNNYNCGNSQPVSSYSYPSTSTPTPQPAVQTVVYSSTPNTTSGKSATIPNTGPGNILALGGISAFLGTIGHLFYKRHSSI